MTINDEESDYTVRFMAASFNDFSKRVADLKSVVVLKITTAFDLLCKSLKCLSDDSKEQIWLLIEHQIASDDLLKLMYSMILTVPIILCANLMKSVLS